MYDPQKQQDDPTNLMLAVVLAMLVLFGWQLFFAPPPPISNQPDATKSTASTPNTPTVTPEQAAQATRVSREAAVQSPDRLKIDTPELQGSINLRGGRIDDLVLKKYRVEADPDSANVVLFSPANAPNPYFAEHGWTNLPGIKLKMPARDTQWQSKEDGPLTPGKPATIFWNNGEGLEFQRTIAVDEHFMFTITDTVENKTSQDITLFPYARIYRYGTPKIEGFWIQHEGLIGWLGDEKLEELTYSGVQEDGGSKTYRDITGGWLGITDKYWAAALIPDQNEKYAANLKLAEPKTAATKESFQADYLLSEIIIKPGENQQTTSRMFAGAKKVEVIEQYEKNDRIEQFDYLIDWGWFDFITYPLFHMLHWFYGLTGNFGLAILAVTIVVKALFFPLANKAYESMARMKALQPQMEEIRERFKDDKERQQKALMKLYQEEKINPLAGCLPILFQIPVFFALYKVLFVSIDMRHAPFFGWVQDLSAPDPTSIFNLFGLLPFGVPDFLLVGVWPIIMGVTMWLQMQLNPPQPDPTQQMIFNWMPLMFTFLLATFPAGLVIYWAWNNVLSIAQQWYIMKKQGTEVALFDNLKKTIAPIIAYFDKKRDDKTGA